MKKRNTEKPTQEPMETAEKAAIALSDEELTAVAGGERWWEWEKAAPNPEQT